MAIFLRTPLRNRGVECRWGRHKSRFSTNIWLSIDDCCSANNNCDLPPCSLPHRQSHRPQPSWMTTAKRRQKNRIYLYEVVHLKRNLMHSAYCAIEAADRHEASRGLSATAELLVSSNYIDFGTLAQNH